jgi:hypothetical protein
VRLYPWTPFRRNSVCCPAIKNPIHVPPRPDGHTSTLTNFDSLPVYMFNLADCILRHPAAGKRGMGRVACNCTDLYRVVCARVVSTRRPRHLVSIWHGSITDSVRICGLHRRFIRVDVVSTAIACTRAAQWPDFLRITQLTRPVTSDLLFRMPIG